MLSFAENSGKQLNEYTFVPINKFQYQVCLKRCGIYYSIFLNTAYNLQQKNIELIVGLKEERKKRQVTFQHIAEVPFV
jgi:hypothetical protein